MIKLALVALLFAVPSHAKKGEKPMEWKGQYGGPIDPGTEVAADAAAWSRLWLTLGQDAPELDFKKYFAVAVFAGERPTGGKVPSAMRFALPARTPRTCWSSNCASRAVRRAIRREAGCCP